MFMYDPTVGKSERRTERDRIIGTNSRRRDFDESRLAEKYDPTYVGEEKLGKFKVHHLELRAKKGGDVAYPILHTWIDAESGNVLKQQEFALSGRLIRTTYYPSKKNAWVPQAVAGAEYAFNYSDEDSAAIGVEYFYNTGGYENADLYPWLLFNGVYKPLYTGKHYGGIYALAAAPGSWNDTTLIGSLLSNLSDRSYLARFDYRVTLMSYVYLDAFVNYHFGSNGEFNTPVSRSSPAVSKSRNRAWMPGSACA